MTTHLVIVPDSLRLAIDAKLDAAIAAVPDAAKDREHLYHELLCYFDDHGVLPEFSLEKKKTAASPYGKWCRDPNLCAGKGYCPRDPTCGD